jgi:hypothetical protein
MKKLIALLSILLCFTACGNDSVILYESSSVDGESIEEDKMPEEIEIQADVWIPFTEDSEGRMVFTDPYYFEPLSLLGYIITEDGDVFIPFNNWEECEPDFFARHVFGTWNIMGNTFIIDESYIAEKSYRNGDIIIFTIYEEEFSNTWVEWLDINIPNVMYGGIRIRNITGNGWDINVNIYKEYEVSPMIYQTFRESTDVGYQIYDYDDFYGFIVKLPIGWSELNFEISPIYISAGSDARISVSFLYCVAGSYDECENASEVLDVLMYLTGINFDADRYSLIEKASYPGTDYDVHRIIYHDFNQWSPLWNDIFIISDGERHFKIELSASFEEDYHSNLEDIKFVVDNFVMK